MKSTKIIKTTSGDRIPNKVRFAGRFKLFGAIMLWLMIWPLLIGAIAFVVLFLFAGVYMIINIEHNASPAFVNFANRVYMLLFTAVMALVCLVIIRREKTSGKRIALVGAGVLKVYACLGILLGVGIACAIPDTAANSANAGIQTNTTMAISVPTLEHDPNLTAVLRQVGATDIDMVDQRYVDGYNDPAQPDKAGEYQPFTNSATGQFVYGTLTVKHGLDPEQEKITAAHEYLHHVWFKLLDSKTKDNLTAQLIGMYGNDPIIRSRVKSYVDAGKLYPTELFSYYCTESSDGYLTEYVLAECNKYINRTTLQLAR